MVTEAWSYKTPTIPKAQEVNNFVSRYREIMAAAANIPTLEGSTLDDYLNLEDFISSKIDKDNFLEIVNEIPDGPISGSLLNGEDLKDLLNLDDMSSMSNKLLDWLALYTGSRSRIHLTSRCSYDYDAQVAPNSSTGNNSFSFPVIALTSSPRLVFPFKINGEIKGICEISPMPTKPDSTTEAEGAESKKNAEGAYNNATHQVHLNYMRIKSIIRLLILLMRRNIITNMRFLIRLKQSVLRIS
jgi:hypothetical protein